MTIFPLWTARVSHCGIIAKFVQKLDSYKFHGTLKIWIFVPSFFSFLPLKKNLNFRAIFAPFSHNSFLRYSSQIPRFWIFAPNLKFFLRLQTNLNFRAKNQKPLSVLRSQNLNFRAILETSNLSIILNWFCQNATMCLWALMVTIMPKKPWAKDFKALRIKHHLILRNVTQNTLK